LDESATGNSARDLLEVIWEAFEDRAWDHLVTLYHPDALLTTMASGEEPLSPSASVAQFKRATEDPFYHVTVSAIIPIDPNACLALGRIRFRHPQGGLTDSERYWLYIFKDRLLWRGSVHRTRQGAMAAYKAFADVPSYRFHAN